METLSTNKIQTLKSQGLTNNQIIQALQRDGYRSSQIFDALNQVSIQKNLPAGSTPSTGMSAAPDMTTGDAPPALQPSSFNPTPQPLNNQPPAMSTMVQSIPISRGSVNDEELIETIIDEKWNDLLEDINRIIAWKERTTQRIDQFEQQFKDLKEQFDRLHQAVIGKVGEYDQHILQVGAEVKAMEKVFSKVLPTFTENVGELSRVADYMKKVAPKKTAKK